MATQKKTTHSHADEITGQNTIVYTKTITESGRSVTETASITVSASVDIQPALRMLRDFIEGSKRLYDF